MNECEGVCRLVAAQHHEVREVQVLVGATKEAEAEEMLVYFSICLHVRCLESAAIGAQCGARSE